MDKIQPYGGYSSYPTNNKRYTKIDEYEAFLMKEENSFEYEERLIDYSEDYENYDPYLDWDGPGTFY